MKKLAKLSALALAACMAASCFTACGSAPAAAPSEPEDSKPAASGSETPAEAGELTSGELTVWSWNVGADALSKIADLYMQKNPNAKVTVEYVDSQYEKLRPALVSGVGVPDVFTTQRRDFPAFMNTYGDIFADVSDVLTPEHDNFTEESIAQVMKDGKYYAFPWDAGPCGLFYHKPTYEKAGIDPATLKTWDDFAQAARVIKEKTGCYAWATDFNGVGSNDEAFLLMNQQGGQVYDADGKVNLDNAEMQNTYKLLMQMKEDGTLLDIPGGWNDRIKAINEGKLASLPYAVWFVGTFESAIENGAGEWGIAPLPAFEEGKNMATIGGSVCTIYKDSPNVELAKDFLKFAMMDPEAAKVNIELGLFSAYKPSYDLPEYEKVSDYFGIPVGTTFAQWVDGPAINYGTSFTDIGIEWQTAQGEIMINGKDISSAMQEASERAQRSADMKS